MTDDSTKTPPPSIFSEYGQTTEWARKQAATNMRNDPEVRRRVEMLLVKKHGQARGLAECRRRYPEAYADEPKEAS